MGADIKVTGKQVDVSVPTRTVVHNKALADSLGKDWAGTISAIRAEVPGLKESSIAVDEYGRVLIFDKKVIANMRAAILPKAAEGGDTNYCGCEGGNCLMCGKGK